jgi:hypothetical protein
MTNVQMGQTWVMYACITSIVGVDLGHTSPSLETVAVSLRCNPIKHQESVLPSQFPISGSTVITGPVCTNGSVEFPQHQEDTRASMDRLIFWPAALPVVVQASELP